MEEVREIVFHFFTPELLSDVIWIVVAAAVGFIVWLVASSFISGPHRMANNEIQKMMAWFTVALMLIILTASKLYEGIAPSKKEYSMWSIYAIVIILVIILSAIAQAKNVERIVRGILLITVGLLVFWAFLTKQTSLVYTLVIGYVQGLSIFSCFLALFTYLKLRKNPPPY